MKLIRVTTFLVILIATSFLSVIIYQKESKKRAVKTELVELSKVKYGLFNVDEWKRLIAEIVSKKLEDFNLEESNREQVHERISKFLKEVIDEFEKQLRDINEDETILGISIKNAVIDFTGIFDEIHHQIPEITDQIIAFLNDPENRQAIQEYLLEKLNNYTDNTFAEVDYSVRDAILTKYGQADQVSGITFLTNQVNQMNADKQLYSYGLFALIIFSILLVAFLKNMGAMDFLLVTLISFVLLGNGLLLPMIDIDARISEMNFKLLGESISFTDQVLYYKSKSVLEVVQLMVTQQKADILVVGLLIFAFSVLFPVAKLASTLLYLFSPPLKQNRFINFLAFKTGKWSMADVMVVAIFMAYIGFSGIISEQLSGLEGMSKSLEVFTTNHSSLQIGFFLFTGFVVLSLLLTGRVQKRVIE